MFPGFGTLLNASLVLVGSSLGLIFSRYVPERIRESVFMGIGIFTILIGIRFVTENKPDLLKVFASLIVGSLLGHILHLEEHLSKLTGKDKSLLGAFISSSLLFTVGPMTLTGCILEATRGDSSLLITKSLMDGFSSILLATSMGRGVALSSGFILLFQGGITALAYFLGHILQPQSIANILCVGGVLMVVVGLRMLEVPLRVSTVNLLPSLILSLFL